MPNDDQTRAASPERFGACPRDHPYEFLSGAGH
jgi:hypothetical protein